MKRKITLFLLSIICSVPNLSAQKVNTSIYATIMAMDSLLFEVAFNECDLALYKTLLAEDLEFYDDRSGLNSLVAKEIAAFKDRCEKPFQLTRKLIDTEVDVLGDFGAIQSGTHIFMLDSVPVEAAKFVTVWQKVKGHWVVKRAISYGHQSLD